MFIKAKSKYKSKHYYFGEAQNKNLEEQVLIHLRTAKSLLPFGTT